MKPRKLTNKYLFWFHCALALLALPAVVQAQFIYTATNGAITITAYTGSGNTVTVPAATNGMPVVSIGLNAFLVCTGLTSITIPNSVTNYAWPAFSRCTNLLAVFFQGNSPRDAFPAAPPVFYNDPNVTLYYQAGTTNWRGLDGLPEVEWNPEVLDQLVYTTNDGAIDVSGYTGPGGAVTIPAVINGLPVVSIGEDAFINSVDLTNITFPNTLTNFGSMAFAGCTGLTGVVIPNSATGVGVFSNCTALANVTLSGSANAIAGTEFYGCTALTDFTVPISVSNIGEQAFQNCYSLDAVYFQGSAPAADATVFTGDTTETNYYFPKMPGWGTIFAGRPAVPILFAVATNNGAITIDSYLGIDGAVTIPDTLYGMPVTALRNFSFNGADTLTNILIGDSVANIAGQAFVGCSSLQAINVDSGNPFYSSLDGVLFDKSQDAILYYPGGRTGSYTLPKSVTSIPSYAFQGCNLASLTVPAGVNTIGTLAFNEDGNLTAIYFEGNTPNVEFEGFDIQDTVIAYYLPGTINWSSNLGGLPVALWLPQAQGVSSGFGAQANQFGFNINWASGQKVVVDASTNLINPVWTPLETNTLADGVWFFSDPQWTNYPGRFYRISSQ